MPNSEHFRTNISREFHRLLTKNLLHTYRLHKICNSNNVKLSYSTISNMPNLVFKHNKTMLKNKANSSNTVPSCNCRVIASCPLKGKCREKCIIYKASLTSDDNNKHYFGSSKTEFKVRFYNHNQSIKYHQKSNATDLSKVFWRDKSMGKAPKLLGKL